MTHIEEVLGSLNKELTSMALLVLNQLKKAKQSLLGFDKSIANEVLHSEKRVNALELSIDKLCENIVALYGPVAKDMRMIFSYFKINSHLERVGDYAKNIAKEISEMEKPYDDALLRQLKIEHMFEIVDEMIGQNLAAIATNDAQAAHSVFKMDIELDKLNAVGNKIIANYIMSNKSDIEPILNLSTTLRRLERVGDYNTNIAEELIFYFDAVVLKHNTSSNKS